MTRVRFLYSLVLLLTLLAATAAQAGPRSKLLIQTDRPIGVWVDGEILPFEEGTTRVVLHGVEPGLHTVEFRTLFGSRVGGGEVQVPGGGDVIVRARWQDKRFTVYDTVLLEPVAQERIRVERPLSSEEVSLHVGVSVTGTDVTITETVTSSDSEFHTVEELVPATRSITFRSTDEEWANVYLDGRKVWEIRAMDREKTITVATGEHTLEIRDFMENETWCKGRLFVDGRTDLIVGITEDQPVEVYNDRFAFGP